MDSLKPRTTNTILKGSDVTYARTMKRNRGRILVVASTNSIFVARYAYDFEKSIKNLNGPIVANYYMQTKQI